MATESTALNAKEENAPQPRELCYRTWAEWIDFVPAVASVFLIELGFEKLHDCGGIPSLPAFALTFGFLNVVRGAFLLVYRLERERQTPSPIKLAADYFEGSTPQMSGLLFGDVLGVGICLSAVWGAAVTFGETRRFAHASPEWPHCIQSLYIGCFLASSSTVGAVSVVALLGIYQVVRRRAQRADMLSESAMVEPLQPDTQAKVPAH